MIDDKTLEEFIAKQSITELINNYLMCVDEKNLNAKDICRFFSDKVSVKLPFAKHVSDIKDVPETHKIRLTQFDLIHHIPSGLVIRFNSSCEAEVKCYLHVMYKEKNSPKILISIEVLNCAVHRSDDSSNDWRISGLEVKTVFSQETQ